MVEFFREHINPASPTRAKAVVYINATGTSKAKETDVPVIADVTPGSTANGGTNSDAGIIATSAEKATGILTEGVKALGLTSDTGDVKDKVGSSLPPVVLIDDLRAFKNTLQLSAGAQPVNDVSLYVEGNLKL